MERREEIDAKVVAIGNGKAPFLDAFLEDFSVDLEAYTDPGRKTFQSLGMKRPNALSFFAKPKVITNAARSMGSGHRQGKTRGDPFQNGGVIIVDGNLDIVYRHIESEAGDLADLDEVVAALA